jgi:hypothetical protein
MTFDCIRLGRGVYYIFIRLDMRYEISFNDGKGTTVFCFILGIVNWGMAFPRSKHTRIIKRECIFFQGEVSFRHRYALSQIPIDEICDGVGWRYLLGVMILDCHHCRLHCNMMLYSALAVFQSIVLNQGITGPC